MPKIPEYTSSTIANTSINPGAGSRGVSLLQPTERGSSAFAQMGRTQGALANAAGNEIESGVKGLSHATVNAVNDYLTNREVMKFNEAQPDYMAAGVLGWKNLASNTDITDPSKVAQFNDSLVDQDKKFLDSFNTVRGKELAMNEIRRRRDHMSQVQIADVATRTGQQAVESVVGNVNKSAAIVQQDPHYLDIALASTDEMIARLVANPALTEQQRAKFQEMGMTSKRDITQTAFLTMAQANPVAAKAAIEGGWKSDILTPDDRAQLTKVASLYEREARSDVDRAAVQARRQEEEATQAATTEIYSTHFNAGTGEWTDLTGFARDMKQLAADHPTTAAPVVRAGLDMIERLTKEANGEPLPVADTAVAEDFRARMLLPPDDPNRLTDEQIFNARAKGRLSNQEFAFYKDAVSTLSKDPEKRAAFGDFGKFLNGMKSSITSSNPLLGKAFPEQDRRFYQFQVDMRAQFDAAYRTGGDWRGMITPGSANYLGKQISPYQLSNKEGLNTLKGSFKLDAPVSGADAPVVNPATAGAARQPGESIAAFEKRKGGK